MKDAVNWLLSLCSSPNTDCRHTCMELVLHLAEYITGVRSSADVLKNYQVIHGDSSIVQLCEGCGSGEKNMSLPMQKPGDDPVSQQTWLRHLLASLECYIWILEHNLALPLQIFCSASPNIFIASINFVKDEIKQDNPSLNMLLSISELEELEEIKSKILINIIDLIYHIIENGKNEILNRTEFDELFSPLRCAEFWQMVCLLILKPVQAGFSLKTHMLASELQGKLSRFINVLPNNVPTMENELTSSLGSFMTQCHTDLRSLSNLNETVKRGATTDQINYTKGLCTLYKAGLAKFLAELETLFDFLNNDELVKNEKLQVLSPKGEVFYQHLKTPILEFLLKSPDMSICAIMSAVNIDNLKFCHTFLNAFYRMPALKQRYSSEVGTELMKKWPNLKLYENKRLLEVMDIVAYIVNITKKEEEKTLNTITKWICYQLASPHHPMSVKRRGLDIVLPLLTRGSERNINSLRKTFPIICQHNFPIKSSEYPSGSTQLTEYKTFFLRLLSILEKTESFMLLEFIASVVAKDGEHVCLDAIQSTVTALVARLSPTKQLEAIDLIFKNFTDEETLPELKINYVLQLVVPMLQACDTVEQFFITHIGLIGSIISTPPVLDESLSDFRASKQLMPHICAFSLVELLYSQLPKESLLATSAVGKQFSPDPSKVMSQVFLTKAVGARSDESTVSPSWRHLYMQYQCCAFKAAISITCCLFPDPKAFEKKYNMFIFTVSTNGNIWSKIVDCSRNFDLKMDFENIPKRKKKLVCIRKSARVPSTSSRVVGVSLVSSTVQYPASQKLFDSTLCEDVSRFDLSHVDLRSYDESDLNTTTANLQHPEQEEVMLELDAINSNDCMAVMCALVKHCSSGYEGDNNGQLPEWMKNIRKVLCSASQHKNVKLFIIKLILNVEEVFKPFAKYWLDPLCMAIVDGSLGESMNYVLSDTVSMILSWHDIAIPSSLSEVNLASNLLELLINLAYHRRQDITKHNLELIKTLVEVWKPILNVKYQLFFNICQLRSAEPKLQIGLQVVAILLANKVLPWNDIGSQTFIDNLLDKHFMDTSRRTNQISAEIIGMILKWAHEPEPKPSLLIDEEAFKKRVQRNLKTLYKDKNLFFPSLYTIHKYYNPIVDIFLHNLLYEFLRLVGDFKIKSLELISSRIDTMEDCVREITNLGLDRRMTDRGTGEQEHALRLVAKLIPVMTAKQAYPYVVCIPQVLAEAGPDCRAMAYEVLMQVMRNSKEGPQGAILTNLSISGLMSGLYDQDATLQQKILDFWSSSDIQLPQTAADRFVTLARKLFVKDSAQHFLSTLLQLMLEASVLTPDYNQVIFQRGLSDCKFEKYALHDSWRTRNATMMTPMFAETLSSQVMSQSVTTNSLVPGHLRATQNILAFKPTAELQDDDDEDIPGTSSSALMVSLSETLNDDGGVSAYPLFTREQNSPQKSSSQRKYRFMSDQKRIRNSFARREIQLRAKREQVVKEHKAKQEGQVKVYRTYRFGDFPDIQITSSAVIKPLQVLAKFDQIIARQLFVAMFMGIEKELPLEKLCSATGLASVGCLIIEKYLKTEVQAGPSTSKRARVESDESSRKNQWLKLAELYQSLGERDVVLAVIQEALGPENDLLKAAVQEEATLKLINATNSYRACMKYPDLKDFTTEAYCRCLERLSMNREKLLPWLMKSEVHEILEKNDPKEFASVLLSWSKEKDKLTYLKRCFNEELSLVNLIEGEIERSRLFSRHVLQNFLKDWSVLSNLLPQLRGQKLSQLHSINDIIMFADVMQSQDGNEALSRMQKLCDKWKINQPKPVDSLLIWETRTVYRCFFGKQSWRKRLQELETREDADLEKTLKRALFSQELSLIDLAITQKNIKVALKFIQKTRNVSIDKDLELRHKIAISRAKWLLAEFVDTLKDKLECNLTALEDLRVAVESAGPDLLQGEQIRAKCELAELAWSASKLLRQHPSLLVAVNTNEGWMRRYISPNLEELNCNYVISSLEEYCQTVAMQAVERAKEDDSLSSVTADAMMHVAKFCREIIQREQTEQAVTANLKNQAGLFTTCLLGAMKRGSKQARMMFPCLLQLEVLAQDCNLNNTFKKEVSDVPEWMFLGWINQLLAYMDTKMVEVLDDLLVRVATKYPKAVQLPFQFTQERIAMQNQLQVSSKVRGLLRSLEKILELDAITKKMLKAFSHVAQPEMVLMKHLHCIIKNLENSNQLTKLYNEMTEDVFPSAKELPSSLCGIAFEKIERNHKRTIQEILTPLMSNRGNMYQARRDLMEIIKTLNNDLKSTRIRSTSLDAYCPFLKYFRGDLYAGFEIPGQYTGDKIPLPHHHILVSSFDPTIQVMASLRRPVKLNIIGNNGVVYGYIIKTGEDLRQDERIGQLLGIMNGALAHAVECNALNRAFSNLSSSPEGLYWLRQCFVKSLGTMSIAHWLLGIGDRHLSNMLVSLKTGVAIGIDFGHAFGSATQILPIAEFVPFRLTKMMLNFMGPLGYAGLLRSVMIKSLRAFREHHELLLNTMQVFVLEPSLDWQEHATKLANSFVYADRPIENYAQQKVRLMRHKIEGALPALVMEEEFITGKKGQEGNRPKYLSVLKGDPKHNLRTKLRKRIETKTASMDLENLLNEVNTVEEQVDCLIDQATDLHILGKTFFGWCPWI
ncbi:hypothetical protein B566_EDAN012305 [Ephemera danica]|nr:hypothetical protein B566_EDAN012305 [Ephemera danica]